MRPTSALHVGNYFGALKPLVEYQNKYKTYLMVADIHALTTLKDTQSVRENALQIATLYLAAGVDPKKVTLFVQSLVPEQAELAELFNMIIPVSMVQLNPVYKDTLAENPHATNVGLLSYPIMMAADILAYKATVVPVGKDQMPYIELTREIIKRFNGRFGNLFAPLETILQKELKIMSIQDSSKKMSKSHGDNTQIGLLDSTDQIRKKIKSAVTDSGKAVVYDPKEKPAISNLILLMHLASGESIKKIEQRFIGRGYGEFKEAVASALVMLLEPIQLHYQKLTKDKKAIERMLVEGSKKARAVAQKTLAEAKKKIGLF